MQNYLTLMQTILDTGISKNDRTNTGTKSIFGYQLRFDLATGFPIVTTKHIHFKSIVHELLWFLSGSTNRKALNQHEVHIWDAWSLSNGDLGPIYGAQWRQWSNSAQPIDQIKELISEIQKNPNSRRLVVSSWNPSVLPNATISPQENVQQGRAALAPCHTMFQLYISHNRLSCLVTQRSADVFLGVPFNIASYALLTHMIAQQTNLTLGELIWSGGDCHIYNNHQEQATTQLTRTPLSLPMLKIVRKPQSIFDYSYEDFSLINYNYHPAIKAPVAV